MPQDQQDLLTLTEAADRLRVPVSTLRHMRYRGTGPASAKIGRRVMYRVEDLDAWVASRFAAGQPITTTDHATEPDEPGPDAGQPDGGTAA